MLPFGDMAIPIKAHYLTVPKAKESLESVRTVLDWVDSWVPKRIGCVESGACSWRTQFDKPNKVAGQNMGLPRIDCKQAGQFTA